MDRYDLTIGLPHTNHAGLAEHLLLMHAGHFQWTSIARAAGMPLSRMRTSDGREVYATFYYVEERFPAHAPLRAFQLDDELSFGVFLRAFKGLSLEGRIVFDHRDRLSEWFASPPAGLSSAAWELHPHVRFANIFITPERGNDQLRIANPAGVAFPSLPALPNADNPYQLTRSALETGTLGLLDHDWLSADGGPDVDTVQSIDIDRDTNGAGLVYFANYVTFMDRAEREAVNRNPDAPPLAARAADRSVMHRRIAYYGNVSPDDHIRTRVRTFRRKGDEEHIAFSYQIRRGSDGRLICLSEAIKTLHDLPGERTVRP